MTRWGQRSSEVGFAPLGCQRFQLSAILRIGQRPAAQQGARQVSQPTRRRVRALTGWPLLFSTDSELQEGRLRTTLKENPNVAANPYFERRTRTPAQATRDRVELRVLAGSLRNDIRRKGPHSIASDRSRRMRRSNAGRRLSSVGEGPKARGLRCTRHCAVTIERLGCLPRRHDCRSIRLPHLPSSCGRVEASRR
jgi:hypothetical protein